MPALICAWREGIWPWPGLEHLAVDDALDLVGLHLGAVERLRDRGAAQVGGIEGRETAAHLPEGGPGGGEDDRLRHLRLSSGPTRWSARLFPSSSSMLVTVCNLAPLAR